MTFVLPHGRSVGGACALTVGADRHIRGKIHALLSRPTMNGQANEILKQYQDQAATGSLKFRRWPLRSVSYTYEKTKEVSKLIIPSAAQM